MIIQKVQYYLKLEVDSALLQKMSRLGLLHYPKEFGGFLVGRYSEDFSTLYVLDFLLTNVYINSALSFERVPKDLGGYFQNLYEKYGLYYIGEWHTHPDCSADYSQQDLMAMLGILKDPGVLIKNPILLILSLSSTTLKDYKFFVLKNDRLLEYE